MASIILDAAVRAPAEMVWSALADVGNAHRVFVGVLSDCRLDGPATRVATFANGHLVTERMIGVDATHRRIAYSVVSGDFEHHGASMQIVPVDSGTCRFLWITDVLPDSAVQRIRPLMEAGIAALRRRFEQG